MVSFTLIGMLTLRYIGDLEGCPAGYDGLHPNALGEYQIAHAFTKTLNEKFKIGQQPLAIPDQIPRRPCAAPTRPKAEAKEDGLRFSRIQHMEDLWYEGNINHEPRILLPGPPKQTLHPGGQKLS